jgi:hypothetical protein
MRTQDLGPFHSCVPLSPGVLAVLSLLGCSSSSAVPASTDAGDDGAVTMCDAALPVSGDAGVGVCSQCKAAKCAAELAACRADCACDAIEVCLEETGLDYTACPGAVSAISSGEQALTTLADCTAVMCFSECFPTDGGSPTDAGGQ